MREAGISKRSGNYGGMRRILVGGLSLGWKFGEVWGASLLLRFPKVTRFREVLKRLAQF